jgi:hypothetical protein
MIDVVSVVSGCLVGLLIYSLLNPRQISSRLTPDTISIGTMSMDVFVYTGPGGDDVPRAPRDVVHVRVNPCHVNPSL